MTHELLVDADELADYMSNITLDADQRFAAEMVLAGVQAQLETWLGRPLVLTEREQSVYVDYAGRTTGLFSPILSIASVKDADDNDVSFTLSNGRVQFSKVDTVLTVTYTAGLDGKSKPDIRLAILRVAAREMQNRHDDTLSVSDLTTSHPGDEPLQVGWTEGELNMLRRYKRRVVVGGIEPGDYLEPDVLPSFTRNVGPYPTSY